MLLRRLIFEIVSLHASLLNAHIDTRKHAIITPDQLAPDICPPVKKSVERDDEQARIDQLGAAMLGRGNHG